MSPRQRSGPLEPGDTDATLTNARIAAVLVEIADLLEIKGESSFKVRSCDCGPDPAVPADRSDSAYRKENRRGTR